MAKNIFFAWQLDIEANDNKSFIWDSISTACHNLGNGSNPELSPRPEKDTDGVSGTPNIIQTIFNKIDQCSIFVADVTFIGETNKGKLLPNPNVLLELGYAVKTIGWERTILVLNSAYGKADKLPFDMLQHRWPIEYKITAHTEVREKRWEGLTAALIESISSCQTYSLNRAIKMMEALDTDLFHMVALNEGNEIIEIPMPAKTMGELLNSTSQMASFRRLIDLGAIKVIDKPYVCYGWTSDGLEMIKEINKTHPGMLTIMRNHK